ncbi:MAG: 1-acyl-sn-glycerol-3-phosphate acyltransferase [Nitrospirae bacterium]|nr:1-acyl-sn-glycerol-3-phosphate acyltransferase [Nitrospirota bacterium]
MFYSIVKGILSILIWLFFKFRVFGEENIPKEGGVIIASNHVSYFDIPFLACGIARRADFVAKSELFNNRIFGWILKRLGTFPVKRGSIDRWAISEATKRLRDGRVIVIYPEGARSKDGRLSDPKRGIGMLVALSGAMVIPSFIMGTDSVLPRGARRIRLNPVRLYLGNPLDFSSSKNVKKGKELYTEISEEIMRAIGDLEAKAKGMD